MRGRTGGGKGRGLGSWSALGLACLQACCSLMMIGICGSHGGWRKHLPSHHEQAGLLQHAGCRPDGYQTLTLY